MKGITNNDNNNNKNTATFKCIYKYPSISERAALADMFQIVSVAKKALSYMSR